MSGENVLDVASGIGECCNVLQALTQQQSLHLFVFFTHVHGKIYNLQSMLKCLLHVTDLQRVISGLRVVVKL